MSALVALCTLGALAQQARGYVITKTVTYELSKLTAALDKCSFDNYRKYDERVTLTFEDGLRLVAKRADAMQKACELAPSTMAAILGLEDEVVERICAGIDGVVVPANYNCPGQLVISGSLAAIEEACTQLSAAGAKRALVLQVGGAFHSPLMEPAREELAAASAKSNAANRNVPRVR